MDPAVQEQREAKLESAGRQRLAYRVVPRAGALAYISHSAWSAPRFSIKKAVFSIAAQSCK